MSRGGAHRIIRTDCEDIGELTRFTQDVVRIPSFIFRDEFMALAADYEHIPTDEFTCSVETLQEFLDEHPELPMNIRSHIKADIESSSDGDVAYKLL